MRVFYFSDNGSDHNRRFLEKISAFGHEVWFLDLTGREPQFELPRNVRWLKAQHALSRNVEPRFAEAFLAELQILLQEVHPHVIHAGPLHTCAYLAACTGFHPLVVMSWGSDLLLHAPENDARKHAAQVALRAADGFVCDCDAVRDEAFRYASFAPAQIAQFPWGVESGAFSSNGDLPADWRRNPDVITFLHTRSWESMYGVDVLLAAFGQAYARDPRLRLLLIGDGSQRDYVLSFLKEQELMHAVSVAGRVPRDEMPKWFRAADAYISCSKSDGTSVSLLEAMATGLPVVVTDIPSNREWVSEGINGWLATDGSSQDFADKMIRAAGVDAGHRLAIRERNLRIVAQRADWDSNFPRLMSLYEAVVSASHARVNDKASR